MDDTSAIAQINRYIQQAITQRATDLHIEPYAHDYRLRYRCDGLLCEVEQIATEQAQAILTRLKILSQLNIAEKRLPQDGGFKWEHAEKPCDIRISTCPTSRGEKIVLRILHSDANFLIFEQLGLNTQQIQQIEHALSKPQGLILITGPTGCGKTTTLYTALTHLNTIEKNISSIEDPVEIHLTGVNQINIQPKIGLTFAQTLRCLLRQDPDVLMVGEIRDTETADIAIKAAQTGHLLLSTLHTNSTVETLHRLLGMGVSSDLLGNTLELIITQRLARRLCNHCKQLINGTYFAVGCTACTQGYSGRIGLFEVFTPSTLFKEALLSHTSFVVLMHQIKMETILSLREDAYEKIHLGLTSTAEVTRVLGSAS